MGGGPKSRVFITHSSLDRDLANHLVEALRLGAGVAPERIFCSSIEGYGVKVGSDFMQYILQQLQDTDLVVPLITPAYLDSVFCQWELGAAWVREVKMFPIRVEPVAHSELPAPLQHVHVAELTDAGLNDLVECVAESVGAKVHWKIWEPQRKKLQTSLPGILGTLRKSWSGTPSAKLRRAAQLAGCSGSLHRVFHLLRDTAALKLTDPKTTSIERLQELLEPTTDEIATLFTGMTGHRCQVTVKEVFLPDEAPEVWDLSRSGGRPLLPPEPIEGNTDFESLLLGPDSYFMCNDIAAARRDDSYANSHARPGKPLSYNSAIVWPVRRRLRRRPQATKKLNARSWQDLIAYLCVDSPDTGVFDESIDVWIGAAIADAMYVVLRPWSTVKPA